MGYCISQADSKFFVAAKDIPAMMDSIRDLALPRHENEQRGGQWAEGQKKASWFSWVDMSFSQAATIEEMFKCWRWNICSNENGDIDEIEFRGEKLGQDDVLFNAIAPFVKKDSFIEMTGEDGARWRWVFDGKNCFEKQAKVSWE
jgi:hypothetical protein